MPNTPVFLLLDQSYVCLLFSFCIGVWLQSQHTIYIPSRIPHSTLSLTRAGLGQSEASIGPQQPIRGEQAALPSAHPLTDYPITRAGHLIFWLRSWITPRYCTTRQFSPLTLLPLWWAGFNCSLFQLLNFDNTQRRAKGFNLNFLILQNVRNSEVSTYCN